MPCPFRALFRLLERGLSITLLLAAGMSDRDDDPLASPIGVGIARQDNPSPRALTRFGAGGHTAREAACHVTVSDANRMGNAGS